jgi:hypothetical protein
LVSTHLASVSNGQTLLHHQDRIHHLLLVFVIIDMRRSRLIGSSLPRAATCALEYVALDFNHPVARVCGPTQYVMNTAIRVQKWRKRVFTLKPDKESDGRPRFWGNWN